MVGTTAVNVGIDNDLLDLIIRFDFARDLPTAFQEQGRGSRQPGRKSTYLVMYGLRSCEYLMSCYVAPRKDDDQCDNMQQVEFVAATT